MASTERKLPSSRPDSQLFLEESPDSMISASGTSPALIENTVGYPPNSLEPLNTGFTVFLIAVGAAGTVTSDALSSTRDRVYPSSGVKLDDSDTTSGGNAIPASADS